ncbi:MAG: hypothetical protein L6R37_003607 [Teloschistes peruensis]|nr:MAG: hypothetical protein L6R37_003607 [Teloschistes peruensis]
MVILEPNLDPLVMNGYSIAPLTPEMNRSVQHGIYDGSLARYNNPNFKLDLHDRPEFHGISHYDLRVALDAEGMLDPFILVDERTPELGAVWIVEDTAQCKYDSDSVSLPPVTYPGEDFAVWQARMLALEVPTFAIGWFVYGCDWGTLVETVEPYGRPYDPHDPQDKLISDGQNWTDPNTQAVSEFWPQVRANGTEVIWDPKHLHEEPPRYYARLRDDVARDAGLLSLWTYESRLYQPHENLPVSAWYDWKSPLWPKGYPDDNASPHAPNTLRLPQARQPSNSRKATKPRKHCPTSQHGRQKNLNRL